MWLLTWGDIFESSSKLCMRKQPFHEVSEFHTSVIWIQIMELFFEMRFEICIALQEMRILCVFDHDRQPPFSFSILLAYYAFSFTSINTKTRPGWSASVAQYFIVRVALALNHQPRPAIFSLSGRVLMPMPIEGVPDQVYFKPGFGHWRWVDAHQILQNTVL